MFIVFRRDRDGGIQAGSVLRRRPRLGAERGVHLRRGRGGVRGEVGGPQQRHHLIRQHRLRHADRLPVRHHGGLDQHPLLGEQTYAYL